MAKDLTVNPLFVSSKQWRRRGLHSIKYIILHCSDIDWTIEDLWQYDVKGFHPDAITLGWSQDGRNLIDPLGLPGISYHEVFMKDGERIHCNAWEDLVWHAGGHNANSLGACLMYRPTQPSPAFDRAPTDAQLSNFIIWAAATCLYLGLNPYEAVLGHRELKGTGWFLDKKGHKRLRKTCPGRAVEMNIVRRRVAEQAQKILKRVIDVQLEVDGIWGRRTKKCAADLKQIRGASLTPHYLIV